ncbi:MAG: tryptophan-rich sensory protein [Ignavibacteria bacterium]|nr:tryptophan-rich sensory protein [Ignavibacteria bacterium]MCC7158611.1 tryptophan-rich sensory protein [Ignavibacteria bacterium]
MKNFLKLIICILICQLAGIIGSFFTIESISMWYAALEKPALNPPGWIFAPVWITLYTLMGISLFLVWNKKSASKKANGAIAVFFVQLILNALWSIIFFGLHQVLISVIVILLLWIFILISIIRFSKVSKMASILLVPYIIWVSFAAYLNISILMLN